MDMGMVSEPIRPTPSSVHLPAAALRLVPTPVTGEINQTKTRADSRWVMMETGHGRSRKDAFSVQGRKRHALCE